MIFKYSFSGGVSTVSVVSFPIHIGTVLWFLCSLLAEYDGWTSIWLSPLKFASPFAVLKFWQEHATGWSFHPKTIPLEPSFIPYPTGWNYYVLEVPSDLHVSQIAESYAPKRRTRSMTMVELLLRIVLLITVIQLRRRAVLSSKCVEVAKNRALHQLLLVALHYKSFLLIIVS